MLAGFCKLRTSLLAATLALSITSRAFGQTTQRPISAAAAAPAPQGGAAFPPPDPRLPQRMLPAGAESSPPQATGPLGTTQPLGAVQPSGYNQPPVLTQPPIAQPVWAPPEWGPPARPLPPSPFQAPTRFWFRTELLLWWTKAAPIPSPLVTVGSANDAVPGALGQPGTQTIFGDQTLDLGLISGLRLQSGLWLDANQTFAIEGEYFFLGNQFSGFSAGSDDFGFPLIARPVVNAQTGNEGAYVDSVPGSIAGGVDIFHSSRFLGWEINGLWNFVQSDEFRLGGLLGFRYLNLSETLRTDDQLGGMSPGALTFGGQPISADESLADFDRFRTTNNFYGGLLGARMSWTPGRWVINAAAKVSLGTTQERAVIEGATTLFNFFGNPEAVLPGGVLATTANIGNHYRSPFAVAPEANFNLGFQG